MPEGLAPAEIDAFVAGAMQRGEDLYHLDEGALAGLDADLVVTQDLCAVCAVDVSVVDDALAHLGCTAEVLTIDPHTLDEVLRLDPPLGEATGRAGRRPTLVASLAARLGRRRRAGRGAPAAAGDAAGVDRPAVRPGPLDARDGRARPAARRCSARPARSPCGSPGTACARRAPDVVVVAPCGYDRAGAPGAGRRAASPAACCPPASRCTPSTPTPPGPARAPAWSTASRSSPDRCTRAEPSDRLSRRPRSRGRRPVAQVAATRPAPGTPGTEVGPHDGGAEVVELGGDHACRPPARPWSR